MPPPFPDAHVTRSDLEQLISAPLNRAAALVTGAVRDAGLDPRQLAGVFLVGGSSRIPLVARLVHEQSGVMPTSIDQPETVVARGALRAVSLDPERTGTLTGQGDVTHQIAQPGDVTRKITRKIAPPPAQQFPAFPPPVAKKRRTPLVIAGVVALVVIIGASVAYALTKRETPPPDNVVQGKQISQYDYSFTYPEDWEQTGGQVETRRVLLQPVQRESGTLIAVQEHKLTYDSSVDRPRAIRELREDYDSGKNMSEFDEKGSFVGKDVVYFREQVGSGTVDWYVLLKGTAQVSVGCQSGDAGSVRVRTACEQIVRTMTVTG